MNIECEINNDRSKLLYKAKALEQAEMYNEMSKVLKQLVESYPNLTADEQNLLSVSYKNVVGIRRASWRMIKVDEADEIYQDVAIMYRESIENELFNICDEVLGIIDITLNHVEHNVEQKIFFLKMKGDYYRYKAEVGFDKCHINNKIVIDSSKHSYETALELASESLKKTHPLRLGLALNYSVFMYEILNNHLEACRIAKEAFEAAISDLDNLNEDYYRDSTLIMQLLRDNLTLWSSDNLDDDGEEE